MCLTRRRLTYRVSMHLGFTLFTKLIKPVNPFHPLSIRCIHSSGVFLFLGVSKEPRIQAQRSHCEADFQLR